MFQNKVPFGGRLMVLGVSAPRARVVGEDSAKVQADDLMKKGQFDKAIECYKKSIESNPKNFETHLNIAKTYTFNNQYKDAIPHLETYLKENSRDLENITLLGECYKKSGLFSKSIELFKKALEIEPHYDYAQRNLLDAQNLKLACNNPTQAKQERYNTAVSNLTEAVKIAKTNLPTGFMDNMKDMTVTFDKTSKMGGRSNIAQYEHNKRKISVTDEYTYANPKLTGAYLIHEFTHGHDNDPYTSIHEEQDAYRVQAKYWVDKVKDIYDPEMDYVADLYKKSIKALDDRVEEIYKQRDPGIPLTSPFHPPVEAKVSAYSLSSAANQPLKQYDIIV